MPEKNKKTSCRLSFDLKELNDLQEFMRGFDNYSETHGIDEKNHFDLKLCLEEIIVNVFKHGYKEIEKQAEVNVLLYKNSNYFIAEVTDNAQIFNPLKGDLQVDTQSNLEDRPIGGLGIHFIQNLSDKLEYISLKEGNRLKIHKKLNRP